MRKLSLVIAGVLGAGAPFISQAATLGEARVQSYLSEPLDVRVPLARSSDEPLDEITVKLAPPSFYREAGVPLENITGNLTFRIESEGGRDYVVIGSKRPIRDPILSILLEVDSPQGRMIREFNLLLDPPSAKSSPDSPQRSSTAKAAGDQPSAGTRTRSETASWERVEPTRDVSLDATREVRRGDTLYDIAREYVDDSDDVRPMMQAIIDANPKAFANGNGNALMAGAQLKVPGSAKAESTEEADTSDDSESSETAMEQLPALELLEPEDRDEGDESSEPAAPAETGGFGNLSRERPLAAIADSTQADSAGQDDREAALDREEVESVRAENEALTEELRGLKDQIDSIKVGVDDRDARISELQEVIEQSRAELERAQAASDNFWVQWGKYLTGALGLVILALLIALGLKRSRRDDEPGIPMPATADRVTESRSSTASAESAETNLDNASSARTTGAAAAVGGASATLAGAHAATQPSEEPDSETSADTGAAAGVDDPMNPEMALEEARVLESFNLTHQAVELLQDSLAEHPGHSGLQSALNRLKGVDEQGPDEASSTELKAATSVDRQPGQTEGETEAEPEPRSTEIDEPADSPAHKENDAPTGEGWDEDLDDMLATSEADSTPLEDDGSTDWDDSFALETPSDETGKQETPTRTAEEPADLNLPENEVPPASVEASDQSTTEPEALDLDLTGYEPAGSREESAPPADEDSGLELDLGEPRASGEETEAGEPEPKASEEQASDDTEEGDREEDIDTRVGLAEAFLDVGDRESFDMIEAELREEGATAALERLETLKARYDAG
ncbi:MAG: FimV/HubP family polar landmark protein [Guyparkeria sp.]|uniref:FimV/HubP family polar landmark protein n=1 Tax=Guyparkeria sp. TaxID=2035736 RepID=UPI003978E622